MNKRVILITGTPCTGKTSTAKALTIKLKAEYINLTDFAKTHSLTTGEDKERNTLIINEEKMQQELNKTINTSEKLKHDYRRTLRKRRHAPQSTSPKILFYVEIQKS